MELDRTACYRALRARDARFDGRFFTAVRSTGVYCRPICPARLPKLENCRFLPSAAAAQELGYRPCLRCRPEASPGTPAWLGTSATVSRALRLIAEGALDAGSVDQLATRLGVGERHLRRLFVRHIGLRDAVRLTIPVPGRPEYTYRIEHIHKRITTPPDASLDLQSDLLALAIVRHDRLTLPLILKEDE